RELGADLRLAPLDAPPQAGSLLTRGPVGWARSWCRGFGRILGSAEFRSLGRRCLETDPIGRLPRYLLEKYPGLDRGLRRALGTDAAVIYRRPGPDTEDLLRIRPRGGLIRIDAARKALGYEPRVPRERALELTLSWLQCARLVKGFGERI